MEDARDDIAYNFNGEGYAVRNRVSSGPYNKYMFGVSISFRTFDENALLFLAINKDVRVYSNLLNTYFKKIFFCIYCKIIQFMLYTF